MNLVLQREILSDKSTIGELSVNEQQLCYTLEDQVRFLGPKIDGKTAIPAGRYKVAITHSARFGKDLPILHAVPGFEGVRLHSGNTSEDTEGCILVGLTKGTDFIGESRAAFDKFYSVLQQGLQNGGEAWIDIRNPEVTNGSD